MSPDPAAIQVGLNLAAQQAAGASITPQQLMALGLDVLLVLQAIFPPTTAFGAIIASAIAILQGLAPAPAPTPPHRPRTSDRHRGRRTPDNLLHLKELSHLRHGERLQRLPRATAPSFDARQQGWIGPVKDQGQCGSCWDFSGTGVVEAAYNKAGIGGGPTQFILSEEYTLDCGRNGGCGGDDNTSVLAWAKSTGLPLSSAYGPYQGGSGFFGRCKYAPSMALYKIPDWGFADSNGGQGVTPVDDIKAAIQAYGCVGAAIAADNAFETWGENNPSFTKPFLGSGSNNIDHDIILVGWQDDPSIRGGGYWILRNSWSASWGVGGYCAIAYGANQVGTEAVFALPPGPGPGPGPTPTPTPTPTPPISVGWSGSFMSAHAPFGHQIVSVKDGVVTGVQ